MNNGIRLAVLAAGALVAANETTATASANPLETPPGRKPRVVITTDPELDDSNSLVRYLLYSADFQTEGLIYASSQFHWKGDGTGTKGFVPGREYDRFGLHLCPCTSWRWDPNEHFIDNAVAAYEQAWPNLRVHNPGYPIAAKPGEVVKLSVTTGDPDGNRVAVRWWRWTEAGSYPGSVELERSTGLNTRFMVPQDAKPTQTLHVIAAATDDGAPPLTRYEQFVIQIAD